MSSDVTNLHHPGDQIVNRWQWHILRIVTNVWISLILLLAAGLVLVSIRVSRIRSRLTAAAAAGPSSWIFHRLYLSQMHALTRSRPLCYRPLSQRWAMLATSISGGEFVPKESKMWQEKRYLWRFYPIAFTLSQHQWLGWVLVCPLSNAENVT